jgi:hypothetical protein
VDKSMETERRDKYKSHLILKKVAAMNVGKEKIIFDL